jgi:hypothetical protein
VSLETQIAALVTAANSLTASVSGKIGQIDQKVVDASTAYLVQLEDLKNRLPRLAVSKNMLLRDLDANGRPDDWGFHSEVTLTKLETVSSKSEAAGRSVATVNFLAQIEADVKEIYPDFDIRKSQYYRQGFNVWKMQWAANSLQPGNGWLAYPYAVDYNGNADAVVALPRNSYMTVAGFVRVVDGALLNGSWVTGARVGKWAWCSSILAPTRFFGTYEHLHPIRSSSSGLIEVALVGACTGVVTHPGAWFSMLALS